MNNISLYLFYSEKSKKDNGLSNVVQSLFASTYPNLVATFSCPVENVGDCPISPQQANVSIFPTLLFLHQKTNSQAQEVFRMPGYPTAEKIKEKINELAKSDLTQNAPGAPGSGTGSGTPGTFFPGFGLFNLSIDLPNWVWWGVALGSAYQANKIRTQLGKYGFGALGVTAAANAINKK